MHVAGGEHALVDLARELARHQRAVAVEQEVVGLGAVAAADDVDVAGAAGDDQAGLGALALDQRVDGDGRAVDQLVDRGRFDAALVQAVDDALHELGGRGQALGLHECAGLGIEAEQVGEGSSDVDGDDKHARVSSKTDCLLRAQWVAGLGKQRDLELHTYSHMAISTCSDDFRKPAPPHRVQERRRPRRLQRRGERNSASPQPSVGAHIRALESQIGQPLFHRQRGSRPKLTKAGEALYTFAVDLLRRSEETTHALDDLRKIDAHEIAIAVHRDLLSERYSAWLTAFATNIRRRRSSPASAPSTT